MEEVIPPVHLNLENLYTYWKIAEDGYASRGIPGKKPYEIIHFSRLKTFDRDSDEAWKHYGWSRSAPLVMADGTIYETYGAAAKHQSN